METPLKLTYTDALRLLEKAVADKGENYVYPYGTCVYFDTTTEQPACIVGHVLASQGVTRADLRRSPVQDVNRSGVGMLTQSGVLDVDEDTADLLSAAQHWQDIGYSWGEALERAREQVKPNWV